MSVQTTWLLIFLFFLCSHAHHLYGNVRTETSPWLNVAVGLVGGLGDMRALSPTLSLRSLEEKYDFNGKLMCGKDSSLVPIPSSVCTSNILEKCQKDAQRVGDVLGLSGAALVEGYLNRENGDFILCNVDVSPYLGTNSQVLQQVSILQPSSDFFSLVSW